MELNEPEKQTLISMAITALSNEFSGRYGQFADLGELPDFVDTFGASGESVLQILYIRTPGVKMAIADAIARYPNFLIDLANALELERLPRRCRPARKVT